MSGRIRVSPKHGVNPSLMCCFACGESYGVALLGKLPAKRSEKRSYYNSEPITDLDPEAPRAIRGDDLCDTCKGVVKQGGVILIECLPVPDTRTGSRVDPPVAMDEEVTRTGRIWGITGDAWSRIFTTPRPERGVCFVDTEVCTNIFGPPEKKDSLSGKS